MLEHEFEGDWTERKLEKIRKYLPAYMTILSKKKGLTTGYIDAFAGTGYRTLRESCTDEPGLFDNLEAMDIESYREGSAWIALRTEPPFNKYIFIEKDKAKCSALENLKRDFPALADRIDIQNKDANESIVSMCSPDKNWKAHRAVMFLDPFGMQVEWSTIRLIASTKAIDLWYLFPIGSVNRLLTRSGCMSRGFAECLDRTLGATDWRERFYVHRQERSLFGDEDEIEKDASFDAIGGYIIERLKTQFPGVTETPYILRNSKNSPLFMLCFAVGNPKAIAPALNIARDLMKD
ncbi:MAG: three-Cys-motif partner protein TcmP [Rectinemataceae bacterium]